MTVYQDMIGKIINQRWEIIEFLGEGSMSRVFKTREVATGKVIVLKQLKTAKLNKDEIDRIIKSAKQCLILNHENISSYYDIIESDGEILLFCDFLIGQKLSLTLSQAGRLDIDRCIELIKKNLRWFGICSQ